MPYIYPNIKNLDGQVKVLAAFHISQDIGGIWIMDQWADDNKKKRISSRYIQSKGKLAKSGYVDSINNADAYSVIE